MVDQNMWAIPERAALESLLEGLECQITWDGDHEVNARLELVGNVYAGRGFPQAEELGAMLREAGFVHRSRIYSGEVFAELERAHALARDMDEGDSPDEIYTAITNVLNMLDDVVRPNGESFSDLCPDCGHFEGIVGIPAGTGWYCELCGFEYRVGEDSQREAESVQFSEGERTREASESANMRGGC